MKPDTLSSTRRFAKRAAIFALVAISMLVTTSATAQAAQKNQAAYKLAINRYTQILKIKKSTVQAAETKAYNVIVPCWESWMKAVVAKSQGGTLPSSADPATAIDTMAGDVAGVLELDANSPIQNAKDAVIQTQLNRHQFNAANAARAKRGLALIRQMYSIRICAVANKWLSEGLTSSTDPNLVSVFATDSNKLSTAAYKPVLLLPAGEVRKLNNLESRVTTQELSMVKQVMKPIEQKLVTIAVPYYLAVSS